MEEGPGFMKTCRLRFSRSSFPFGNRDISAAPLWYGDWEGNANSGYRLTVALW